MYQIFLLVKQELLPTFGFQAQMRRKSCEAAGNPNVGRGTVNRNGKLTLNCNLIYDRNSAAI